MDRLETLKTLNILALAALVFHFVFGAPWLLILAALLLAMGAWDNPAGRAIASGWLKFAAVLGHFNTKVILGLIFYLVLTPVALLYRLFNRAAADHFRKDPGGSLFTDIPGDACSKESFEKPW
ncbi:MAG: SxtJ family membrane protein [Elusimicrobiales bacterium]